MIKCGIDIGGSKISYMIFNEKNQMIAQHQESTPQDYPHFLKILCHQLKIYQKNFGSTESGLAIGISIAGRVFKNNEGKTRIEASNLPFLKGQMIQEDLENTLNTKISIENDANCFALSEAIYGEGQGYGTVLGLIFGTGVGAGLVYQGKVIQGRHGLTGEWGHIPFPYRQEARDGPALLCGCGQYGCICTELSVKGLLKRYEIQSGERCGSGQDFVHLYNRNKIPALKAYDFYLEALTQGIHMVISLYDPDVIVIGGGAIHLPSFSTKLHEHLKQQKYLRGLEITTPIKITRFGSDSGARGAVAH